MKMDAMVTTPLGIIKGIVKDDHKEFLGIRYAKPPVHELRFAEPKPIEAWDGIYEATRYGPMAPQVWEDDPPIALDESEDCLFLNVYTPDTDSKKRPVMFYIHGGAYGIGSGSRPRLYGGHLAEHGNVVVVTIQYRLGPFGFLYMDGVPRNLGLKDQICALKWAKENISVFGGDPDNVTIFGQSAGSISVSYLLTMPGAQGLFHKAIAQSATFPLDPPTHEKASKVTKLFLSKLNVNQGDVETLRTLSWNEIIHAQSKIGKDILSENHHGPVHDGDSIPLDPLEEIKKGIANNIPLMIGHTSNELPIFEVFLNSSNIIVKLLAKRMITSRIASMGLKKEKLQTAIKAYRHQAPESSIANSEYDQLLTDMGFRLPSIIVADAHSGASARTYFYEFAYKAPKIGAAVHVLDLFFLFGTLDTTDISDAMRLSLSDDEKRLSQTMMDAWVSFARSGNPNHPNLPQWDEYDSDRRSMMILDVESKLRSNHLDDTIKLWKSLLLLDES